MVILPRYIGKELAKIKLKRGAPSMRYLVVLIAALVLAPPGTSGAGGRAGEFDYYVLALSWNAAWCEAEGAGRGAAQCNPDLDIGFTLHGLWPQHIIGWPEFCKTPKRDPSRSETAAMADIMGSGGLAWYQWKKHGRCTGLDPADYFTHARKAWQAIERPELLRRVRLPARIASSAIEQAFLEVNAGLPPKASPSPATTASSARFGSASART
jgi:ribonuclease T2